MLGDGHAFTMTRFWLWNLLNTRTSHFSNNALRSDTWRVELLQCCPPVKTSVTQHHCDSSCASESIVLLKEENNSYTCSCSYFFISSFGAFVNTNTSHFVLMMFYIILYLIVIITICSSYLPASLMSILSEEAPLAAKPSYLN